MLVNDRIFMYAEQVVSDCNRDYVKDSFAKHEPREPRCSRTKTACGNRRAILLDTRIRQIRDTRYITNRQYNNNGQF